MRGVKIDPDKGGLLWASQQGNWDAGARKTRIPPEIRRGELAQGKGSNDEQPAVQSEEGPEDEPGGIPDVRSGGVGSGDLADRKRERGLTEQMLKSVCREYHVRREWLTEGTGEMFRWDKSDLLERIDALLKTQGDPAQRLFRAFVEMRDDEWAALRRFIHRLAASDPGAVDFQAAGR